MRRGRLGIRGIGTGYVRVVTGYVRVVSIGEFMSLEDLSM